MQECCCWHRSGSDKANIKPLGTSAGLSARTNVFWACVGKALGAIICTNVFCCRRAVRRLLVWSVRGLSFTQVASMPQPVPGCVRGGPWRSVPGRKPREPVEPKRSPKAWGSSRRPGEKGQPMQEVQGGRGAGRKTHGRLRETQGRPGKLRRLKQATGAQGGPQSPREPQVGPQSPKAWLASETKPAT